MFKFPAECIAALGLSALMISTGAQAWQSSISPLVELAVRDKGGTSDSYTVTFIVTEPTGERVSAKVKGRREEFPSVQFPKDFNTYYKPGKYSWQAFVGGKEVAAGRFAYETVESGARITTSHY